jgi:hypothetical protein
MRRIAAALIHYPVLDRAGEVVTAAITNIDLHDISRSALTFGLSDFYVVHPVAAQRELAERIKAHWVEGSGGRRIPDRKPALSLLRVLPSLEQVMNSMDPATELWTTSAQEVNHSALPLSLARSRLLADGPPVLLCFGTGWGLAPSVLKLAREHLEPIRSPRTDGYNHLSVRAAAAILFDRLLGSVEPQGLEKP